MTISQPAFLTLAEFLKQPETQPASKYIDGKINQKPIPKTRHSKLRSKLMDAK
ncbi:MAG: Uma2 family endonuclease [Scytolyngbya sp. HA4215-MV1]|jgi:Uma2 family endonuclease|nr:Uma2 family endonuclease [Scytolyngbya sp. HA4215-MV1]